MSRNFFDLGFDRRDDEDAEYLREVHREYVASLHEPCPNPSCCDGNVEVRDGSAFPSLALCGICNGRGYIVTEAK